MSTHANARPIIKRKKVVQGGGHHGGAWKVAYADFVTAMMAFFMLMWLLGATTEKQRKGIADYFNPTIPVNRISGGGEGAFGGDSVFSEETLAQNGTGAGLSRPTEDRQARGNPGEGAGIAEDQAESTKSAVQEALLALSGESDIRDLIRQHIVMRVSDEGLVIEFFDRENASLFEPGTDAATPALGEMLPLVATALRIVVNEISIQGHVPSGATTEQPQDLWKLSSDRADRVRVLMLGAGFDAGRVLRVTGYGDRQPVAADPSARRNARIEIVVLRTGA